MLKIILTQFLADFGMALLCNGELCNKPGGCCMQGSNDGQVR